MPFTSKTSWTYLNIFFWGSAAALAGVNSNTATLYFHKLQEEVAYHLEHEAAELMCGEIKLDESYFSGVCKGERKHGAGGKIPVFGSSKSNGG